MNKILVKRGLDSARTSFVPAEGEIVYSTDTKKIYVGDGSTNGGNPVASGIQSITVKGRSGTEILNPEDILNISGSHRIATTLSKNGATLVMSVDIDPNTISPNYLLNLSGVTSTPQIVTAE